MASQTKSFRFIKEFSFITMDVKQCPTQYSRVWIHINVLHGCLLLLTAGSVVGFWLCFTEIVQIRKDLNIEIAKRTMVEFGDLNSFYVINKSTTNQIKENDDIISHKYRPPRSSFLEDISSRSNHGDGEAPLRSVDYDNEQKLIRVKRRARKKPAYYKEGELEDIVWLTSYSRIPVSSLRFLIETFLGKERRHSCKCVVQTDSNNIYHYAI